MLTLHIAGLRIYDGKSVIVRSWYKVRGKRTTVPRFEQWDMVNYLLERNIRQHKTCQLQPMTFVLQIQ